MPCESLPTTPGYPSTVKSITIQRHIAPYTVTVDHTIADALKRIDDNNTGVVFALNSHGRLEGILTDGDFRRWLIGQGAAIDLNWPVARAMSRKVVTAREESSTDAIRGIFSDDSIKVVPLVDDQKRLVAIAMGARRALHIGPFPIDKDSPIFVIAEIGNNHNGSLDLAKKLIDAAVSAGADCAKFQMRQMHALYANAGNPNDAREDLGAQYTLELLARFSLSNDAMFAAFDYCKEKGILPLCTPWDEESLALLEEYGMPAYKVASADLTNHALIEKIAATRKPIILSTGMASEQEIRETVELLKKRAAGFVLLHCNSTYPAPFKDLRLHYMAHLAELGDCPVGYSGHERDIAAPIATAALGAKVIEKHFTLDKEMEGNDHKVSLLPEEFRRMVEGIRQVEQALGDREARTMTQGERMNRETLAKSVMAVEAIPKGAAILPRHLGVKSPGKGLQPNRIDDLIGLPAPREMAAGDFFFPSDLETQRAQPKPGYDFRRPWGLPVRYHDFKKLLEVTAPDLLEFHLSFKDMDEPLEKFFDKPLKIDFVVHSPELFAGDHTLDLCCEDDAYRNRSIGELQRVIDLTRAMKPWFPKTKRPMIVTNVGGFTSDRHLTPGELAPYHARLKESMAALDREGVEIIPQTMPPFPWHFGGQRYHNLFLDADAIVTSCRELELRICLDLSHSKLTCNHDHASFQEFLQKVGPYTAHMHLADAQGVDGEGLQIDEGDIDFAAFARTIDAAAPDAWFIPEVWQGHTNDGEGFWIALDRLERWFKKA